MCALLVFASISPPIAFSQAANKAPLLKPSSARPILDTHEQRITTLYKKASPAVVNITIHAIRFDDYLNPIPKQGSGSGAIVTADGTVVTNSHVVKGAQTLEITTNDGSQYPATLLGIDPSTDLAILKIKTEQPQSFPYLPIGNSSNLEVGQTVLAIGNPFGFNSTLSTGVISSLDRRIQSPNGRLIDQIIQTDAAINPGNSGGPLLNSQGELIGINTAIFSPSGGSSGISFAIPVNQAVKVVNDLIQFGRVIRPFLGLKTSIQVNPRVAKMLQLNVDHGLVISHVVEGSPADKAGLKAGDKQVLVGNRIITLGGDVIVEADHKPVWTFDQFIHYLETKEPDQSIELKIYRNGDLFSVSIPLTERPEIQ